MRIDKWIKLIIRLVISLILWTIKDPAATCSCCSLRTRVTSTGKSMFGSPCFFSSMSLMTCCVSRPPPSPAKPTEPLEPFLIVPLSSLSLARRSFFSSSFSSLACFFLNSLLTSFFYLSLFSLSFLCSLIIRRLISAFSISSLRKIFLNSSVRWAIKAEIFLSGRSYLRLPIATRQRGHSFLPYRL